MKNLFLLAKHFASGRDSKSIGIADVRDAAEGLQAYIHRNEQFAESLSQLLNITLEKEKHSKGRERILLKMLDKAKSTPKINFSSQVKKLYDSLSEKGYSIHEEKYIILDEYSNIDEEVETIISEEDIDLDIEVEEDVQKKDIEDPILKAIELKKALSEKIFGQDIAIEAVVDSVKNKVVESTNMPAHTFFFLGPPATGKTYMAKTIAENFDGYDFLEINMQSYQNHHDGQKLFGTEAGWSTAAPGLLTSYVRKKPKTVILLDEFEKAHTNVQKKLLSIFSNGTLNDSNGWVIIKDDFDEDDNETVIYDRSEDKHKNLEVITEVDFTQTIFVITSNLGSELYNNSEFLDDIENDYDSAETTIIQTLLKEEKKEANEDVPAIVPEMISRISQGKIVLFNKLDFKNIYKISENIFQYKLNELLKIYSHIKFEDNNKFKPFLQCLLLKFAPYMDVRRIKSKVYERFSDQVTDCLVKNEKSWKDVKSISINVSEKIQEFILEQVEPKIVDSTLLKNVYRKNLTLELDFDFSYAKDGRLSIEIVNASFVKVKKVEDTVGNGGVSFDIPETSFDMVAGHDHVKNRLKEIANLLKDPQKLEKFKAEIPKGMLLFGIPGTGKTMLAKAFANYADLPFVQTTANDLIDHGNSNLEFMKTVFRRARDYSPSIVFIDEIDTVGSRQKGGSKAVINELLTQINGFSDKPDESIFIIAATNHKDDIDPAILRPGRIELHVEIPTLDVEGRKYFINKMLELPCKKDISVSKLVMYTAGMTGAQLEKVENESALYALRNGIELISEEIILEQINIEKYGNRITGKSIEEMLGETAYHEAGHAVISKVLNPKTKIEQITVAAREDTLGFVSYDLESSNSNPSKKDLENKICVAYAGRIAQMKEYGEDGLDTGAASDLAHATKLAYLMVANLGMDEEIGYMNLDGLPKRNSQVEKRPEMENLFKEKIELRIESILKSMYSKTEELVQNNWKKIDKLAKLLLEKEVVHEVELEKILKN